MSLLPYDCGVTLPDWQRYTHPKFVRLTDRFKHHALPEDDVLELAAFLRLLPVQHARFAFHWGRAQAREGQRLLDTYHDQAEDRYLANIAAMTPEAGVAILHAMRRGGWPEYNIPSIVRACFFAARDQGKTVAQIAEMFGVSRDQAAWPFRRGPARRKGVGAILA